MREPTAVALLAYCSHIHPLHRPGHVAHPAAQVKTRNRGLWIAQPLYIAKWRCPLMLPACSLMT